MKIAASEVLPGWLVEQLPSFDMKQAMRVHLRHLQINEDTVEEMLARGTTAAFQATWEALVAAAAPGDSLWYFRSPAESWASLCGRAGFALVRGAQPIAAIVTQMS